jgi:hypothetical protein
MVAMVTSCHPRGAGGPYFSSKSAAAQNARCYVCHINYQDDKLVVRHVKAGIGCPKCHGPSDAHCGDENNITAPDILYARDAVKPACMKCHLEDELARESQHKPMLSEAMDLEKTCTDCHGSHRLALRTVRWDKTTRELRVRD